MLIGSIDEVYYSSSYTITKTNVYHNFILSIMCAPFARKTTGSNPDISSALIFLASAVECLVLIFAIGC